MRFRIFSTAAEQIAAHARADHPREACGLLLGTGDCITRAVAAANVAATPQTAFEIDPASLLRWHRAAREGGAALLGWYHSHPAGAAVPSTTDAARAIEDGRLWLIQAGDRLAGFVSDRQGEVAGRFRRVDLILLSPGAVG